MPSARLGFSGSGMTSGKPCASWPGGFLGISMLFLAGQSASVTSVNTEPFIRCALCVFTLIISKGIEVFVSQESAGKGPRPSTHTTTHVLQHIEYYDHELDYGSDLDWKVLKTMKQSESRSQQWQ